MDELAFWGKGEEEVDLDLDEVDVFEGEDADAGWDLEGRKKGYGEGEDEKRWYGKEFAVKVLSKVGMDVEAQLVEVSHTLHHSQFST